MVQKFYSDRLDAGLGESHRPAVSPALVSSAGSGGAREDCAAQRVSSRPNHRKRLRSTGQTWTAADAQRFLAKAKDDTYWPLWLLALKTGLRRGELLGVRLKDLDLDKATLRVQQTVQLLKGAPASSHPRRMLVGAW